MLYVMAEQVMPGCTLGVISAYTKTGPHGLNFFIDENGKFWLIEPQSDEVMEKPEDYSIYRALL
jgi:hypothetical protein